MDKINLPTIISGGQTGADRGALDGALAQGVRVGGFCPADGRAEDGVIDVRYGLTPLPGAGYRQRTLKNIDASDGTVIIYHRQIRSKSGTELTLKSCIKKSKPYLLIDMHVFDVQTSASYLVDFIKKYDIKVLNVAGPRESAVSGIHAHTMAAVVLMVRMMRQNHQTQASPN